MNDGKKNEIYGGQYVIAETSIWKTVRNRFFGKKRKTKFMRGRSGKIYAVLGALFVGMITALCSYYGLFGNADYMFSKTIFKWINHEVSDRSNIKLIFVDDVTEEAYGKYENWSRSRLAKLIEKLESSKYYKPSAVGILLDLKEAKTGSGDKELAEVCKKYDNICATTVMKTLQPYVTSGYIEETGNSGGINTEFALQGEINGKKYDSFAIAVYKKYLEKHGEKYTPPATNYRKNFSLNYLKSVSGFKQYSFFAVLGGYVNPKIFKDSIVLIADDTAKTKSDQQLTDHLGTAEVQENVIDALIAQTTGQYVSGISMAILYAVFIGLFFFFTAHDSGAHVLIEAILDVGVLIAVCVIMNFQGYYLRILVPVTFLIIITILNLLNRYLLLRKTRHQMETVLKKYVDKNIVNEIVSEGNITAKIGGLKKDIAVLFVDIRGFTSLSESMEPEQIVEILNRYLSLVSEAVSKNQGTLDKFIGDAAMAVFNSPFDLKNYEYHAACAAWDIKESSAELNEMCEKEYGKKVNFGIGIHCGEAVIGNIGSELHMDYTAIGDTVNTASRLEGSALAGQILISEEMKKRLGTSVETSFVGNYTLKGKKKQVPVYSLDRIGNHEEKAVKPAPVERIII